MIDERRTSVTFADERGRFEYRPVNTCASCVNLCDVVVKVANEHLFFSFFLSFYICLTMNMRRELSYYSLQNVLQ